MPKRKSVSSINEGELFKKLSDRANFMPEDVIREVYFGLIKVIIGEFRDGKEVILPGLGKFRLVNMKDHKRVNIATGEAYVSDMRKIAFSGCAALKKYINQMTIKVRD